MKLLGYTQADVKINVLKMFMIEWLSPVSDALSRGQMKN